MAEDGRWDLHEVPTHFDTEDRWIIGRYTTLEGMAGAVAGAACYLFYRFLPNLGTVSVREVTVPVAVLILLAIWLAFFLVFVERWGGERVSSKLWRRMFFAVRPKKTVWEPRASASDRRLVEEASADDEEDEE